MTSSVVFKMAACSELEEKSSSSDDTLLLKIFLEERSIEGELSNKLDEESKTDDLTTLSDDEFLHLLKEASTFNKPGNKESVLLTQLRKEVAKAESRENANVDECSEHKQSEILLCNSVSSSPKPVECQKKAKCRDEYKNALNSDKNVQQSLSLQDLLCPETKTKKSHKAHRTLSLSSEEAADLISDSVLSKTSKKLNKQFNSSKCVLKTSGSFAGDSSQNRKYEALIENSTLPYEPLIGDCDFLLPDGPRPNTNNKEKSASESPVEIEMEEIKTTTKLVSVDGNKILSSHNVEKTSKNDLQQSNSKFYIDSNELVSHMENGQIGFPLSSWASQPMQVQTLLQSLPLDPDAYSNRGDKQLLSADVNGNPFSRSSRPSLASFVSTTLLDYNNSNMVAENKNRKNKRLRNAVDKGVLSENIAGHRGEEDIDTLLKFINSSDKKCKSVKGNAQNQLLTSKSLLHENDKKKVIGKDFKNCHKNLINAKKKLSRSNSLENLVLNNRHQDKNNSLSYESNAILDKPLKNSKSASFGKSISNTLDINRNVETHFSDSYDKNKVSTCMDESIEQSASYVQSSPEISCFTSNFYSTANVSSQTVEESGFLIVKKKKRRNQGKRSDYRWHSNQTPHKKGIMLPLSESKCGKQDSRRKSTSSVPHSDHSSPDNSDLDSVHSLPVRGSVPHPKQTHPHTTPSSSSSTPQASYADIARMPIPKLSSPSPSIITYSGQSLMVKQPLSNNHEPQKSDASFFNTKRRALECPNKITSKLDDCVCSEVKLRSDAKSTREINTQTEPQSSVTEAGNSKESFKIGCSVCCSFLKKSCSKSQCMFHPKIKSSDIPPVIMDNVPAETNTCNVSFGFGVDEVLQMAPAKQIELKDKAEEISHSDCRNFEKSKCTIIVNKTQSACDSNVGVPFQSLDLSSETSSHLRTVCYGTGRNICYNETQVNIKKFNLSEITNFLGMEFQCIANELGVSKSNAISSKIMYYVDSAEEA